MAGGGLHDFLDYVTGNTDQQRTAAFIDNDLPGIVQNFHGATQADQIHKLAADFVGRAVKAGLPPQAIDALTHHLADASLQNMGADEISKLQQSIQGGGGSSMPATFSREGEPETAAPAAQPRQFGQGDAVGLMGLANKFNIKIPQQLAPLLTTPSAVQENEAQADQASQAARANQQLASQRKVETAIKDEALNSNRNLPNTPDETGISPRALALGSEGKGLMGYMNNAANNRAEAPLRSARVGQANAAAGASGAAARASNARAAFIGGPETELTRARTANVGVGANGDTEEETTTDRVVSPDDQLLAERAIAKAATDRGIDKLPPEQQGPALAKLAADFGYDIQGNASLDAGSPGYLGGMLGGAGKSPATMKGQYSFKPKPKVTTKTKTRGGASPAGTPAEAAQYDDAVRGNSQDRQQLLRDILSGKR